MKFKFRVITEVKAEANHKKGKSRMLETKVLLQGSQRDLNVWKSENGLVNEKGLKVQTQGLIQGLVANIHFGHQTGMWDSAEHLRYIIKELEKGFAHSGAEATVGKIDE